MFEITHPYLHSRQNLKHILSLLTHCIYLGLITLRRKLLAPFVNNSPDPLSLSTWVLGSVNNAVLDSEPDV